MWCRFLGTQAGDCGTRVQSTVLARRSWTPFESLETIPEDLGWSENSWKFQIEALCYAWAFACNRELSARNFVPRKGLSCSLVKVLGKKIDARIPADVWGIVGKHCSLSIPLYSPKAVQKYQEGERDFEVLKKQQHGESVHHEWPKSSYDELVSYEEDMKEHQRCMGEENDAEVKKALSDFIQFENDYEYD